MRPHRPLASPTRGSPPIRWTGWWHRALPSAKRSAKSRNAQALGGAGRSVILISIIGLPARWSKSNRHLVARQVPGSTSEPSTCQSHFHKCCSEFSFVIQTLAKTSGCPSASMLFCASSSIWFSTTLRSGQSRSSSRRSAAGAGNTSGPCRPP